MSDDAIILFPARAPIGRVDPSGAVYMTPEFTRALGEVILRMGGPLGPNVGDLATELATPAAPAASYALALELDALQLQSVQVAQLRRELEEQTEVARSEHAALAQLRRELEEQAGAARAELVALAQLRAELEQLQLESVQARTPTDWEHPGKIGAQTPNSGAFTTLKASGQITSTLANGTAPLVVASQTLVANLNAALLGGKSWASPDTIGNVTPGIGNFTTVAASSTAVEYGLVHQGGVVSGTKTYAGFSAGPLNHSGGFGFVYDTAGTSFFHLTPYGSAEGSVFKLDVLGNLTTKAGFGCNGKAAQSAYAVGAAATDAATTQTLANNLRLALIANGIAV